MNLSELLDMARTRLQAKSDRELCRALRINIAAYPAYRSGNYFPTDDRMVRICVAAGVSPEVGLLLLNQWRSSGETRATYRRIAKMWEQCSSATDKRTRTEQLHV